MHKQILTTGFVLFSFMLPLKATAANFKEIYIFGDSLSDVGNVFNVSEAALGQGLPPPPYFSGRFSNGPVWVEYLTQKLGLTPTPYIDVATGGNTPTEGINFAFGGATTGNTNTVIPGLLPGLEQQINNFTVVNTSANADALYIVWAGANDYLGGGITDPTVPLNNLSTAVTSLYNVGARNIMVVNLPDLGRLPGTSGNSQSASRLSTLSSAHNSGYSANLDFLSQTLDINIIPLDVNSLLNRMIAAPGEFSFTNVTTSCLTTVSICPNPNEYLFWDDIHPTTAGHQLVAELAFSALQPESVPEPSTELGMLAFGALGAVSVLQRLQRRVRSQGSGVTNYEPHRIESRNFIQ